MPAFLIKGLSATRRLKGGWRGLPATVAKADIGPDCSGGNGSRFGGIYTLEHAGWRLRRSG